MLDDMDVEFDRRWLKAIETTVGGKPPASTIWRGLDDIITALTPFMGPADNHGHLPTGGGMDFKGVSRSRERGCLEFEIGDRTAYVMRPEKLTLEYLKEGPVESFLLLELADLEPSGVYEKDSESGYEPLVDLDGEYLDYDVWNRGFLEHDENGHEVPIPRNARIVNRFFRGKVVIVAKHSIWNGTPDTYDGRHDKMTVDQIRGAIERSLTTRKAKGA